MTNKLTILAIVFFFKLFDFILLHNTVLVLPYINMNLPRVYTCSPSWTPPSTSLPIPSLWVISVHQPQASCILHRTYTGDLFLIWYYACFNAILPNHPTLSLSHRVQKTVLYICVSFAVALWPSNPTAGHTHRGNQNWKRHVYPNVHPSTVYNSQDMEAI